MNPFLASFPESDQYLAIYYALQEAGLPCNVIPTGDAGTLRFEPLQTPHGNQQEADIYAGRVRGFVEGWVACHNREALPTDQPLQVSWVGQGSPADREAAKLDRMKRFQEHWLSNEHDPQSETTIA